MVSTFTNRIDGLSTSVAVKAPVRVTTTANITLSGLQTVNSVVLASDDRILVKDQTDPIENGIYDVSTSEWQRSKDFDGNRDVVNGTLIWSVEEVVLFRCDTANPITIGSSSLVFGVASPLNVNGDDLVTLESFGAVGDGVTDDSIAIQAAFSGSFTTLHGTPGKTYFCSELTIANNFVILDMRGSTFKHKKNPVLQRELTWNDWLSPFTERSTGQETMITITGENVIIENASVDGNGVEFLASAGYPNTMVKMFSVENTRNITFDNVHIADNNGMGVEAYNCENVVFKNGSITNTRGLTGAITSFEQISFVSCSRCKVFRSEFGGYTPGSCIATVGGFVTISNGSEVGGFIPFNTPTLGADNIDKTYINFGRATGDTDTFHEIYQNVCRSDITDANQAGGGGVLARVVTINSGQCFVKDNLIYDTTDLSQGGLGLGHNDQPTTGDIVYARVASRSEISGNIIFGFRKSGQGLGILSIDAEDVNVHDNTIYDCNTPISHTRWATTGRYHHNYILLSDIGITVGDVSGASQSHGLGDMVEITNNKFFGNLQDIVTLDQSTASAPNLRISGNSFDQSSAAAAQLQFDIFYGILEFNDNKIKNRSTGNVADFFTIGTGEYVECNGNEVECFVESASDLFFHDGSSGDTVGRGSLDIKGLTVSCPDGGSNFNRRINIRRLNTKGCNISDLHLTNCFLTVQNISGDVTIDGGQITTQGTGAGITLAINNAADPKVLKVSNILFPVVGATNAITTSISASSGSIVVSDCITGENKEVTDRANGVTMRNNVNYKDATAANLTASRP